MKYFQNERRLNINRALTIHVVIDEGYPLASIQIIASLNKFKSELTEDEEKRTMDVEQRDIVEFILNTISTVEQDQTKQLVKHEK